MKQGAKTKMRLIIGGAYQGKLEYAKLRYATTEGWIDGRSCAFAEIETCSGIHHFHEYVRRLLVHRQEAEHGQETGDHPWELSVDDLAEQFADWLLRNNPDILIVSNELGYGIVPMEPFDREYRETVGRICTCLAARSQELVRVICGLGLVLKQTEETSDPAAIQKEE